MKGGKGTRKGKEEGTGQVPINRAPVSGKVKGNGKGKEKGKGTGTERGKMKGDKKGKGGGNGTCAHKLGTCHRAADR